MTLWWLGQSGFVLSAGGVRVAIDPFLSVRADRAAQAPCTPGDLREVDAILVTHEHIDHMDLPSLRQVMAGARGPRVFVPRPLEAMAVKAGLPGDRVAGVAPGEAVEVGPPGLGATVWPVPARHALASPPAVYDFGLDISDGEHRYLGYVVRLGGVTVYHSGDCIVYDGQAQRLRDLEVDVALLPINGRDHYREARNITGNFSEREASDLAAEAGIDVVVPMHYEMFAHNTGEPGRLIAHARAFHPEQTIVVPALGRGVTVVPAQ